MVLRDGFRHVYAQDGIRPQDDECCGLCQPGTPSGGAVEDDGESAPNGNVHVESFYIMWHAAMRAFLAQYLHII